jgi:hypothetical protein
MCPTPIGVAVRDQPLHLEVVLTDLASGVVLGTGAADFVPRCPEGDQLAHCIDICSG